jgi:hypothetical protein
MNTLILKKNITKKEQTNGRYDLYTSRFYAAYRIHIIYNYGNFLDMCGWFLAFFDRDRRRLKILRGLQVSFAGRQYKLFCEGIISL